MKQRIFAILLVVALLVTVGAVAVFANSDVEQTIADAYVCPCHGTPIGQITEWDAFDGSAIEADKHYRLEGDIAMQGEGKDELAENAKCLINLNGFNLTGTLSTNHRIAYLQPNSVLTIVDTSDTPGTITGGGNGGGVFSLYSGSTLNLFDANLVNGRTTAATSIDDGSVIRLSAGTADGAKTTFNMYSGSLDGGLHFAKSSKYTNGAVHMESYTRFNMYSGTIYCGTNKNSSGGGVYMNGTDAQFHMYNGTIDATDCEANRGGAVAVYGASSFTMDNGEIIGGTATRGGAVFVQTGTVTINNGTITGGSASYGNSVQVDNTSAKFYMNGGTINGADINAQGTISNNSGTCVINSGVVNGNIVGHGTTVATKVTVSGNAVIQNLDMTIADSQLTIGEGGLEEGAKIGINGANGTVVYTEGTPSDIAQYLCNVGEGRKNVAVDAATGAITLSDNTWCEHCKADVTWEVLPELVAGNNDLVGDATADKHYHYYLNEDVSFAGRIRSTYATDATTYGNLCFDLNGHTITSTNNHVFWARGGDLAIMDSGVGGTAAGNGTANGGVVYMTTGTSQFDLYDGTLEYCGSGVTQGGVIYSATGGAVINIHGGKLTGGKTKASGTFGGSVYLGGASTNKAQFTMTGGTIEGGQATTEGGNIYFTTGTIANISGGTITGGIAPHRGGNIRIASSSYIDVTISGDAEIVNGVCNGKTADSNDFGGGNIFNQGRLIIEGGTISGGNSTSSGGNILNRNSLEMTYGTITGGEAAGAGDNLFVHGEGNATISGGKITDGDVAGRNAVWKSFILSGDPTIDNLNLTLVDGLLITLGEGGVTGGSITVTTNANVPFSVADATLAESSKGYFHAADETLVVGVTTDGELVLIAPPKMAVCAHCGGEAIEWIDLSAAEVVTWKEGTTTYKGYAAGHYYLSDNFTAATRIALCPAGNDDTTEGATHESTNELCIDLNNYTLDVSANTHNFWVRGAEADLAIMDLSNEKGGKVTNDYHSTSDTSCGSVVYMTGTDCAVSLYSGTLEATGTGVAYGGVIGQRSGNGSVNVHGGTITGGKAFIHGGNIYIINSNSEFNMTGGTVSGGSVVSASDTIPQGGNISCAGTFTMSGGTITGGTNQSTVGEIPRGGNVWMYGSASLHTISGGIIEDGTAIDGNGGNIYLNGGTLTISGENTVISDGSATRPIAYSNGGGNIYGLNGTTLDIQGGTISGGNTSSLGGNVMSRGVATIASTANISGGTSEHAFGCDVYSSGGELTVEGLGEAWSGRIGMTYGGTLVNDTVGVVVATYHEGRAYDVWYSSVEAAKAEDTEAENTYIALTADGGEYDLDGHVVDVRGFDATVNGDATFFDSANEKYDAAACGVVTRNSDPKSSYIDPNGNLYITVAEEGENTYSFHRLSMTFGNIYLRPGAAGIYYNASWNCDDVLAGNFEGLDYTNAPKVLGYGIALKKNAAPTAESFTNGDKFAYTFFDNNDGVSADFLCNNKGVERNSCLLTNIVNGTNSASTNQSNAQVQIYVSPYIKITNYLGNEEYILGDVYGNSMKGIVEYFVSTTAAMEDGAAKTKLLNGLTSFYNTWCADDTYGLNDFFTGLEELVAPAE